MKKLPFTWVSPTMTYSKIKDTILSLNGKELEEVAHLWTESGKHIGKLVEKLSPPSAGVDVTVAP